MISAAIEAEVAQLTDEAEKMEFLSSLGLSETGLDELIRAGYALLGLITFFTGGPKEARAWTVRRGDKRPGSRRRHPHRLRARLHPLGDRRLRGLHRAGGEAGAREPASCAPKARITWCRTATCSTSGSTSRNKRRRRIARRFERAPVTGASIGA